MIHLIAAMTVLSLTHLACYASMSELKYSVRKTALIYALFWITFVSFTVVAYLMLEGVSVSSVSASFLYTIAAGFLVFLFTSKDPLCKKVFLFVSYSNIFCIFQLITFIVCEICFPDIDEISALYVRNIIRTLLYVPMIWVYIRFLRPTVREISGKQKKTWYSISLVSILFLAVFSNILTVYQSAGERVDIYRTFFVVTVLIYCSVLWVLFGTVRYMINENKMELIDKNMKYLKEQLEIARENNLFAKTMCHDFRHHNQNIATMLRRENIHEALNYIEQYNESLDAIKPKEFCPHATVNAILNNFYTKTHNEGISTSIFADMQRVETIDDMDFVAILSNLLENAVNGCKECNSSGEIEVNIRTVADKTVIVCSNPCTAALEIENEMIKDKGTGIESVMAAAKKYDGDISYNVQNGTVTACVILKPKR